MSSMDNPDRVRLLVMTDISSLFARQGEPDDTESLIRLLLYADRFGIEGLIATHTYNGDCVNPDYIRAIIHRYGDVHANLLLHSPHFPPADHLLSLVKTGHTDRHNMGEGMDTEGSDWIISVVDKPDPRPVWITIWGGPRELAQALWTVEQTRSSEEFAAFKSKIRVHAIIDQDNTAGWIREHNPDLFYITNYHAFRGMYRDGDASLVSPEWVDTNIIHDHGPLGESYPNYAGGDPWGKVKGVKEGDTPSFLYLMPNGLGDPKHPEWGSWGGRFNAPGPHYYDAKDTVDGIRNERATVYRWRPAYQAGFAARMDWCTQPREKANHEPIAAITGNQEMTVPPGSIINLSAEGAFDPDGDRLSYDWFFYSEPSSYDGPLTIEDADKQQARFIAPAVDSPGTIHIVLTVTDDGAPPLCAYKRVIVTVDPNTRV